MNSCPVTVRVAESGLIRIQETGEQTVLLKPWRDLARASSTCSGGLLTVWAGGLLWADEHITVTGGWSAGCFSASRCAVVGYLV